MKSISVILLLFLSLIAVPIAADELFEIWLWSNVENSQDKRVVEIVEHHACSGYLAKLAVHKMPSPDGEFEGEKVLELTIDGHIVGSWYMPVNEIVLGVEEMSIISGIGGIKKALKIDTDGTLSYVSPPPLEFQPIKCPHSAFKEFEGSAYLRCFEYRDLKSKEKRLLAYQGPCT